MSRWPECDASLQRAHDEGDPWNYCSQDHCDEVVNYNHQFCNCSGQFNRYPYVRDGICMNGVGTLVPISKPGCYCCCSCLAYDTPVSVSATEVKPVQDFVIGNMMLVATDASLKSWVQKPVKFSSGTGPNGVNKFIKIVYGDLSAGVVVIPELFTSRWVGKEAAQTIYNTLSAAPNNLIGQDGVVNLGEVLKTDPESLAALLDVRIEVAERIYDIISKNPNYILVTGIQPFLLKDRTLKQAKKLIPGSDELVLADGSTTPILSLEVGMFSRGVHHISTSNEAAESLDNHLMIANGIVVGDYSTQLALASGVITDSYAEQPAFGTKEYSEKNAHLGATLFSAYAAPVAKHQVDLFVASHESKAASVPAGAYSYVTKAQALELQDNAPIFPASGNLAEPDVRYLFRLFKAFSPDITFYYDQNNMLPNAYAFEQYGKKFVVINLGWTMIEGLYFYGLAMTIAQLVNMLTQKKSLSPDVSAVGKADYDVYPFFLSLFYSAPTALKNYELALKQIEKVFSFIKKHRRPPGRISIDCRIKALEASINLEPLPHCAGGPPEPALTVSDVSATIPEGSEKPVISVTFNLPVDPKTASFLGNYLLDPSASAFAVTLNEDDPARVDITADILPDVNYFLVVTEVLSVNKQPLITGKNGGEFTLK